MPPVVSASADPPDPEPVFLDTDPNVDTEKMDCFADISSVEQTNSVPGKNLEPERESQRQFEQELDNESLMIENERLKTTVFILN